MAPDPFEAGRLIYDARCASCHRMGSYDTRGYAGTLANRGSKLRENLGRLDGDMSGILLSADDIADLKSFLNGTLP
jgi:mono/diheme cytochrome c family protein